jgi:hypothetical protein
MSKMFFICATAITIIRNLSSSAQTTWQMQPVFLQTRWAKDNLNGLWDYAITNKDTIAPANYAGQILVPYPIESALSGVKKALLSRQGLYRHPAISFTR